MIEGAAFWPSVNPWVCRTHPRDLPSLAWSGDVERIVGTPAGVEHAIATLLHEWPESSPCHLHAEAVRLERLLAVIAGYPTLANGILPYEEPLRPRSRLAMALALQLDSVAPLAGPASHSLRAELLSLDQLLRLDGACVDQEGWLHIVLGWLFAGLQTEPDRLGPVSVLLNVLYQGQQLAGVPRRLRPLVRRLRVAQGAIAENRRIPDRFGRTDDAVTRIAELHLWRRSGRHVICDRDAAPEAPPPSPKASESSVLEVRFHRVQTWLAEGAQHPTLGPKMHRGGSILVEAALSGIRRYVLQRFGPGAIVVDGGARLRLSVPCSVDLRKFREEVQTALGRLLDPGEALGAYLYPALQDIVGFSPGTPEFADSARRLMLTALPPWSARTRTDGDPPALDWEDTARADRWHVGPEHFACINCAGLPDSATAITGGEAAWTHRLCRVCLLRMRLGSWMSRDRMVSLALSRGPDTRDSPPLGDGTQPFSELLVLDLNRLGSLFTRRHTYGCHRDTAWDARRSMRFTTHWLLAVANTMANTGDGELELLFCGGDDLAVGARGGKKPDRLLDFAHALHQNLDAMRAELPPCDRLDFAGGWIGGQPQGDAKQMYRDRLEEVYRREAAAKVLTKGAPLDAHEDAATPCVWRSIRWPRHSSTIVTTSPPAHVEAGLRPRETRLRWNEEGHLNPVSVSAELAPSYMLIEHDQPEGQTKWLVCTTGEVPDTIVPARECCLGEKPEATEVSLRNSDLNRS